MQKEVQNQIESPKTLNIKVVENFLVNAHKKGWIYLKKECSDWVRENLRDFNLERIFSNINNYSRPPTSVENLLINRLAIFARV